MSSKTKCWLWMLLVILSETSATSTLKMFGSSEGTTKMLLLGLLVLHLLLLPFPRGERYSRWPGVRHLVRYRDSGGFDAGDGILRSASGHRGDYRHGRYRQRHRYHESVFQNG